MLRAAPEFEARGERRARDRASGGTRTHTIRLTRAAPDPSSSAGLHFSRPSPLASRPCSSLTPRPSSLKGGRWESNPHNPGSQPGPATALGSATVSPAGVEPAASAFAERRASTTLQGYFAQGSGVRNQESASGVRGSGEPTIRLVSILTPDSWLEIPDSRQPDILTPDCVTPRTSLLTPGFGLPDGETSARLLTQGQKFRGLESNQHSRVQSLSSYRLDDPGITVAKEGFEPSRLATSWFEQGASASSAT